VDAPEPHPLLQWLQSSAAGGLDPDSRRALVEAARAADPDAEAPDRAAVLVDTLDALARLSAESDVLAAALLFGAPSLQAGAGELLEAHPGVAGLLEGQAAAAQVWSLHAESGARGNSEGLRRLLLAIVRDLRVVPILLARQLARMRAAAALPEDERRRLATLTRDIHAPLANRLGIWQLKWELEDLAFRHLEPQVYRDLAQQLDEKRSGRERFIETVKAACGRRWPSTHRCRISGRPKHIYSIWRKMQKKQVPMDELYDLRAVRVAVADVATCYAALGVVHALWVPIPSEFDDYIARPKPNDYRSLHTAVVGPEGPHRRSADPHP
jgi:GTP pyrophosphokinase